MEMIIRKFTEEDMKEVSDLATETFERYCGSDYFDESGVQKVLDSWDYRKNMNFMDDMNTTDIFFVAAEPRGGIVGLIRGTLNGINSLFVKGEFHKKGIGSLLMKKYEDEAKRQGSREISLKSSLFAASFYERMGYEKVSDLINFEGLKVYSMRKVLK